ncbi:hypothetical protein JCM5296_003020 [Sporobolomyces johnsonii]
MSALVPRRSYWYTTPHTVNSKAHSCFRLVSFLAHGLQPLRSRRFKSGGGDRAIAALAARACTRGTPATPNVAVQRRQDALPAAPAAPKADNRRQDVLIAALERDNT